MAFFAAKMGFSWKKGTWGDTKKCGVREVARRLLLDKA
jgi:hypothetical protein